MSVSDECQGQPTVPADNAETMSQARHSGSLDQQLIRFVAAANYNRGFRGCHQGSAKSCIPQQNELVGRPHQQCSGRHARTTRFSEVLPVTNPRVFPTAPYTVCITHPTVYAGRSVRHGAL